MSARTEARASPAGSTQQSEAASSPVAARIWFLKPASMKTVELAAAAQTQAMRQPRIMPQNLPSSSDTMAAVAQATAPSIRRSVTNPSTPSPLMAKERARG
jgi:hypothetical protein